MASELLQFLTKENKPEIQIQALEAIFGLTSDEESVKAFSDSNEFLEAFTRIFQDGNENTTGLALKIITNLVAFNSNLSSSEILLRKELLEFLMHYIIDSSSKDADTACMLMSNISRYESNVNKIWNSLGNKATTVIEHLLKASTNDGYNIYTPMNHITLFVANLTVIEEVRNIVLNKDCDIFTKLIAFTTYEKSPIRKSGVVRIIRNCSFDEEQHEWLLSENVNILPHLLLPLAGPEEFDDEDNESLPVDLQYLPDTKIREQDPEIRQLLIETLTQFCATTFGRKKLKKNGVYLIMRELHTAEENPKVDFVVSNLIQILIGDEPEEGLENLRTVDVPEKVVKAMEIESAAIEDEKEID